MNYKNLNQAIASLQMLHNFYSTIRIYDTGYNRILYENKKSNGLKEAAETTLFFQEAAFCIPKQKDTLEINIPLSINGQPCRLELIQRNKKEYGDDVLHSMQELIITDSLTNLYNRRFIDEQLPKDLEKTYQSNNPLSLIYIDIDYFKEINDHYGHIIGDLILKEIASTFLQILWRKNGWAARYGGDEFLLCLPGISRKSTIKIANRIRLAVEEKTFYSVNPVIKITCSLGLLTVHKSSNVHTVNEVIELLDRKLYQAKKEGRNKVIL